MAPSSTDKLSIGYIVNEPWPMTPANSPFGQSAEIPSRNTHVSTGSAPSSRIHAPQHAASTAHHPGDSFLWESHPTPRISPPPCPTQLTASSLNVQQSATPESVHAGAIIDFEGPSTYHLPNGFSLIRDPETLKWSIGSRPSSTRGCKPHEEARQLDSEYITYIHSPQVLTRREKYHINSVTKRKAEQNVIGELNADQSPTNKRIKRKTHNTDYRSKSKTTFGEAEGSLSTLFQKRSYLVQSASNLQTSGLLVEKKVTLQLSAELNEDYFNLLRQVSSTKEQYAAMSPLLRDNVCQAQQAARSRTRADIERDITADVDVRTILDNMRGEHVEKDRIEKAEGHQSNVAEECLQQLMDAKEETMAAGLEQAFQTTEIESNDTQIETAGQSSRELQGANKQIKAKGVKRRSSAEQMALPERQKQRKPAGRKPRNCRSSA